MKSFKEYVGCALTEAQNFTVKVEVRDARKANDLAQDSYRGLYKNDGSDVFIFKNESDKEDFENDLLDMKLGIIKESVKKGSDLKVGDVILYGREDTPHEVTNKPKQDGPGYWVEVLNLSNKKKDKIYVDSGDTVTMNEQYLKESAINGKGFIAYNTMIVVAQALRKGAGELNKHVEKSVIRRFELDNDASVSKLQNIEIEGYNFGLRDIQVAISSAVFKLDSGETKSIKNITYQIPMI
jgi:hypothetical protein